MDAQRDSARRPLAGATSLPRVALPNTESPIAEDPAPIAQAPIAEGPAPTEPQPVVRPQPVDSRAEVAARRPPKVAPGLRERPALVLPGWVALLAVLLALGSAALVLTRVGVIPRFGGSPDLRTAAAQEADGAVVTDTALVAVTAAGLVVLVSLAGLLANGSGETRVLSRWGRYRGTIRRAGLVWVNPMLRRRRVDVRLRHWRSEPVPVTDRAGIPIVVRVLVVWRIKDTARAVYAVGDHEAYLREQIHAVLTRTASTLPCDSNSTPGPALRDGQWFADELSRGLAAEVAPAGLEVFSVQPVALDYAPEVAESMRRRRLADLDASLRTVLVDDAVEAAALAVRRLERATAQELDEAARSALMEQLLVAFVAPAGVASTLLGTIPAPAARPATAVGVPRDSRNGAHKEGNRA